MFGKSKAKRPTRDRENRNLAQYGLFNVSVDGEVGDMGVDIDGDDSDLEAELLALSSGGGAKPKRPQRKIPLAVNLDAMVAESLKDTPSDEDLSGDDDDPDLLNELSEITGEEGEAEPEPQSSRSPEPSSNISGVLEERLKMYEAAEQNAKDSGETSRARRLGRGIKTIKDLLKQANAGRSINNDDIPPIVAVTVHKRVENEDATPDTPSTSVSPVVTPSRAVPSIPTPSRPAPTIPAPPSDNTELLQLLTTRTSEYKIAAVQSKKSGDVQTAMGYLKIAKQFEAVIKAVESGQPVDLSKMPGPPSQEQVAPVIESTAQGGAEEPSEPLPEPDLITASSVGEALQQRLELYQKQEAKAKEEGNASKARRMGRIIKQFQDAIKLNNAGKPIPIEDLPTPPGYAPIPGSVKPPVLPAVVKPVPSPSSGGNAEPRPSPSKIPREAPQPRPAKSQSALSRIDKQVAFLMERQTEFKAAALAAKKKGEMNQAMEFLRSAKGFDKLIAAAQGGLPIDLSSLPLPPSAKTELDEEFDLVMAEEASELDPEHLDVLSRLEQQLTKQLKLCLTTRDHNKQIGDVASTNRFEQLALNVTKDLDIIRLAKKSATARVPKFHYETKEFSVVKCCTDLNDNDLELTIIRGVNYNCSNPKDVDTYVKFDFPYPQEEHVINKTPIIKNTNNPEYNETFVLPIHRTKTCGRIFKRHGIKFEVFSRGCLASDWACCCSGFFRSDTLLGTVAVKLQPLENRCEFHESFDLQDGRKKVGGKLEIRLRVREPMVSKQVEELSEKWLIIDH